MGLEVLESFLQVYRVHYHDQNGQSKGFDYFGGSVVAHAAVVQAEKRGDRADIQSYDLPLTRQGVLNALQQFGGHPDRRS